MLARLIIALLSSPWYGMMALLASVPVILVVGLVAVLMATGGMSSDDPVTRIVFSVLLVVFVFVGSMMVLVQQVRFAASFSGARRIADQPSFGTAVWRAILVSVVLTIVTIVLVIVALLAFSTAELDATSQAEALAFLGRLAALQEGQGSPATASAEDAWLIEVIVLGNMVYTMILAMILVPLLTGVHRIAGQAWTLPMLLYRLVIVVPCLAFMTRVVGELAVAGGVALANWWTGLGLEYLPGMGVSVQILFFGTMAYAHEAMLLRATGVRELALLAAQQEGQVVEGREDYRAIRERWSADGPDRG